MRYRGFTLVELLLVIAVMSILTAVGVMSYRRYFQANRLDKVAISMQHVLEAAMAFYVDNNTWPEDHHCVNPGPVQENFINNYLPNANYKSYYGSDFCWQAAGAVDPKRLFWVAVLIPGDGNENVNIAKRLAARLPNAITTNDPSSTQIPAPECDSTACYVKAEITVPGSSSNALAGMTVLASGDCHAGQETPSLTSVCQDSAVATEQRYQIHFPACPAGTLPALTITPNFITLPRSHTGFTLAAIAAAAMSCTHEPDPVSHQEQCMGKVEVDACVANGRDDCVPRNIKSLGGQVGASYIVTCSGLTSRRNDYATG